MKIIDHIIRTFLIRIKLSINAFCSSCLKIYFFFFGGTHFYMLLTFLKKKKKFLSSGSAFTKCETGLTLKLLTSKSTEFLLCNKNFFSL
jgi:hypothetical protein